VRPTFVVTLQATPGHDPIRGLRWLLKIALRRFGLRAVNVREVHQIECTGSAS
jgi:hypothetical protein